MKPFRIAAREPDCTFEFEGERIPAVAGEPIAVALFVAGKRLISRSGKFHRPRSFFCLAGHCAACLMRIDGQPNLKACRTLVSPGLRVERQNSFPSGSFDVFGATDFLFPKGMDHHTVMTNPRVLNLMMQKVVRRLGGSGRLPDATPAGAASPTAAFARTARLHADAIVIGGGPAGLTAAAAIRRARPTARVVVFDESDRPGGALLAEPGPVSLVGNRGGAANEATIVDAAEDSRLTGLEAARSLAAEALGLGVELRPGATAVAWYAEDEGGTLAVVENGELVRVQAARTLYATGANDVNDLFANNDRPGIMAARAIGRLLVGHGVIAGTRPIVLGAGAYAERLAAALAEAGAAVTTVDPTKEKVVGAGGRTWVSRLDVAPAGDPAAVRKIPCDLVAVATTPSPASELPRQHGVQVIFDEARGGFACVVDEKGQTSQAGVFACGDVTGFKGVEAACVEGAHVGAALAETL